MAKHDDSMEDDFDESSIYDEEGREDLVEDDEMSAEEEGFMRGYEEAEESEEEDDMEDRDV
ncbi:hypothetical protein KY366_06050 [Candidatus Woesearchaeota archaeon]|nr:hypothetical protein [Candidatus Woesearchaeota archaeon]